MEIQNLLSMRSAASFFMLHTQEQIKNGFAAADEKLASPVWSYWKSPGDELISLRCALNLLFALCGYTGWLAALLVFIDWKDEKGKCLFFFATAAIDLELVLRHLHLILKRKLFRPTLWAKSSWRVCATAFVQILSIQQQHTIHKKKYWKTLFGRLFTPHPNLCDTFHSFFQPNCCQSSRNAP